MKTELIEGLSNSPLMLKELIQQVSAEELKRRRRTNKWSIHENACHLAQAEIMIYERFQKFKKEAEPDFNPYLPGKTISDDDLINLELSEQLNLFENQRSKTVELLRSYDDSIWNRKGKHPQYKHYDPKILLRHTLMHDHLHMYRIEELWLTKDEFL
ncbi:MAG: DinB family protein [Ekhidna sp.]